MRFELTTFRVLVMYVLWFQFSLFPLVLGYGVMITSLKLGKIKFKPRIKLNDNICMMYDIMF